MPIRYAGNDNRITYSNVSVKSVMLGGGPCIYGDEIGYSSIFIYSESSDGYISIDGLTEKGKTLVQITIPQEIGGKPVVSISDEAFLDNQVMQIVTIPPTITDIGVSAFSGCIYLNQINWNAISVNDFTEIHHIFDDAGDSGEGINVIFGDSVKKIPAYAFAVNTPSVRPSIKTVTISDSVTSIGYAAFAGCAVLDTLTIGKNVKSIGNNAFRNCQSLTSINWNAVSVDSLSEDNQVFQRAGVSESGITVTFGSSAKKIPSYLFYNSLDLYSPKIRTVVMSEGIEVIEESAFKGCDDITSIAIPESVTSIGISAFSGCSSLKSMTIPFVGATKNGTSNTHFGYIFGASSYNDNSTYVPTSLKEVIVTGGTSIGWYAFGYCDSLTSVTVGDGVTSINWHAFEDCSGLTSITISASVTSIGAYAFENCSGLTSVYYTGDVAGWCGISLVNSSDGPLYYAGNLYIDGSLVKDLVIPDSVTSIGEGAFRGCTSLASLVISSSVTSIGVGAFMGCTSLASATIGNGVTSTGTSVFRECTSLTSVTIPNSVTSIDDYAFDSCDSLTAIVIPDSVTSIGYRALSFCTSLTSVTFNGTKAEWEAVEKGVGWNDDCPFTQVVCSDGTASV